MKKISTLFKISLIVIITAMGCYAQAQDITGDISKLAGDVAGSTNWTAASFFGRATTGNRNVAGAVVAYGFNQNVGVLAGYDYLWAPHQSQPGQENAIKGGLTLQAPIHPFTFLGSTALTNLVASPFVSACLATPKNGANIGTLAGAGLNVDFISFKNFELVGGAQLEKRNGQGFWDGTYPVFHLGISRRF